MLNQTSKQNVHCAMMSRWGRQVGNRAPTWRMSELAFKTVGLDEITQGLSRQQKDWLLKVGKMKKKHEESNEKLQIGQEKPQETLDPGGLMKEEMASVTIKWIWQDGAH